MEQMPLAARIARKSAVDHAVRSMAIEGLQVPPATAADAAEYVVGAIDLDELIARVRARHTVEGPSNE